MVLAIRILFLFVLWVPSLMARVNVACVHFYSDPGWIRKSYQVFTEWGMDIKETRGRALVFVDSTLQIENSEWNGLLRPAPPFSIIAKVIQSPVRIATKKYYGRPLEFRPIGAFSARLVRPNVRKWTEKSFKRAFDFSKLFLVSSTLVAGGIGLHYFDKWSDQWIEGKVLEVHRKNTPLYKSWLENDYRYRSILESKTTGKIDLEKSIALVSKLRLILSEHLSHVSEFKSDQETYLNTDWVDANLGNPTFGKTIYGDIIDYVNGGIKVDQKKFKPNSGFADQIDEKQISDLMKSRDRVMIEAEVAYHWLYETEGLLRWQNHAVGKMIIQKLSENPFYKKIKALRDVGKISKDRVLFLIQEDIFWEGKFESWEILRVSPIKFGNAQLSEVPFANLTMSDIQKETLEGLK